MCYLIRAVFMSSGMCLVSSQEFLIRSVEVLWYFLFPTIAFIEVIMMFKHDRLLLPSI